jgi:hypothetical protein
MRRFPVIDKVYRSEEKHPAIRPLPQSPTAIGRLPLTTYPMKRMTIEFVVGIVFEPLVEPHESTISLETSRDFRPF